MPARTASVARWTSTGFVSSDAPARLTARASTSSRSTIVGRPRAARSGRVRIDLDEEQARAAELPSRAVGQTARERRLPGPRWTGEDDEAMYRQPDRIEPRAMTQREEDKVEEPLLQPVRRDDAVPAAPPRVVGKLDEREEAFDARRHLQRRHLCLRSALEVVGPHDTRQIRRVELGQLLEEVQRVEEDADHVVERVEVVDADEARRLRLVVIEMPVPAPVVDDDEVALLPRV